MMNKEKLVQKIILENKNLFKENVDYKLIDIGFNNTIYNIDDKYILKINNISLELFKKEIDFYLENKDRLYLPKLYKYNLSNKESSYLILEKIDGNTLYYSWPNMNELEREDVIKKVIDILKQIHIKSREYDFSNYIQENIKKYLKKTKGYFSELEYNMIIKSFDYYDLILSDNKFYFIHNDLHFDNIFLDKDNNIKIIDFNDTMIAPIDYEFRIFYMMQDRPWKWASLETDAFQKREDYLNLIFYAKKYYKELNDIKYFDLRMLIYEVLNDIDLLSRFDELQLKARIIKNTFEIIEYFEKNS